MPKTGVFTVPTAYLVAALALSVSGYIALKRKSRARISARQTTTPWPSRNGAATSANDNARPRATDKRRKHARRRRKRP